MDLHCCRLCLKKGRVAFVNALQIPELCKSVKSFFGFQILATDTCSTKVCGECISLITDALSYKNRVVYNQECIKKEQILRIQIQSIKVEDDDDDVLIVEEPPQKEPEASDQVSSTQTLPVAPTRKRTARKSTTKLPFHVPPPRPALKELCPKRLKVVCTPMCEKDVSHVRISKKTRGILKVKGKIVRRNRNDRKKLATNERPSRIASLAEKLERAITDLNKSKDNQKPIVKSPAPNTQPKSVNSSPTVFSALPAKSNSLPRNYNKQASKPTATVNPSDANKEKVIWCSVPAGTYAAPNRQSANKSTAANDGTAINFVAKYLASKAKTDTVTIDLLNSSPKQDFPASVSNLVASTSVPSVCGSNMVTVSLPSNTSTDQNSNSGVSSAAYVPPPVQQANIVNSFFLNNSLPGVSVTPTPIRPKDAFAGNLESGATVHQYPGLKTTPVRFILPKTNATRNSPPALSRIPPALQNISNCNTSRIPVNIIEKSNPHHKVKVLSVNELNTRASTSNTRPVQPAVATLANKCPRLPIRISLTRMRNEMVIKLTDSQGNEVLYSDMDESEKAAVRSSLLSKESIRQFGQAFQTCSPDEYTQGLLNILGLSRSSFANASANLSQYN